MAIALCVIVQAARAAEPSLPQVDSLLAQAEHLRKVDRPSFLRLLKQLQDEAPSLTALQRWHLRYLEAAQSGYQGDYVNADAQLRNIIDHSGDATLTARASALLILYLGLNHQYEEAFALANRWLADLPNVKDVQARDSILYYSAQMLGLAGQNDLAIKYADMMGSALPPGQTLCPSLSVKVTALFNSRQLEPSDPLLQRALDICKASKRPVFVNNIQLVLASLHLEQHHPGKALALLHQIGPSVKRVGFHAQVLTYEAGLATANWKLGDDSKAMKAALTAVAMGDPDDIDESLRDAYQVLYEIERKRGHSAAALNYYERYVAQDKGYLNDVSARAIAYQVVQQRVLAKKLETEELSKQNSVLRLQQSLDAKAVETSRLYITLLLVVLASIVFWVLRLKRSQLRFKKLSCQDGLTGIFNHQHFVGEADRVLRVLERKVGNACLISIDLDHFKQVNDTHGHAMGDAVLKHTVATCQQHLRPTDLFGRLGGEEFGILLHGCSRDQGKDIADRIRITINATPLEMDGRTVYISASVGLASTDSSGYHLQRLSREADAALYRAKRAGRNRVIADIENDGLIGA